MANPTQSRLVMAILSLVCLALHPNARAGDAHPDAGSWLNVRDCGASGSKFETPAATTDGSKQITVKDVGDFKVGQGVMVSKCNIHYSQKSLWGPRSKYAVSRPLKDEAEVRGYDGTAGSWVVYIVDVEAGKQAFRWTDDLGRTWHPAVPITHDWQPLSDKTEVRLGQLDWESGYTVVITARDQLMSVIEKIEGNVLTLRDAANRTTFLPHRQAGQPALRLAGLPAYGAKKQDSRP